jgi:ketosteroid isomerase-like protein
MRKIESTLLYKWFNEVWNKSNENAIGELMTDDAEFDGVEKDSNARGSSGFKIFFREFTSQFHDISVVVEDVVAQGDMESARTIFSITDTQTNKAVTLSGICMIKVRDGKIAQAWNSYDFLSLSLQLGKKLVPAD